MVAVRSASIATSPVMSLHRIPRAWFTSRLDELAPGAFNHSEHDAHEMWTGPEGVGIRPWEIPWREVRRAPDKFEDLKLFKMSSSRTVVRTARFGSPVFIKRSIARTTGERVAAWVRPPKEVREFILALQWRRIGLRVPEPLMLAFGRDPHTGGPARYYATSPLPEGARSARRLFRRKGFDGPRWEALAAHTAEMFKLGAVHSDFRADHLYFDRPNNDTIWMIDLDGARVGDAPSEAEVRRLLRQLFQSLTNSGLTDDLAKRFLDIAAPQFATSIDATRILAEARAAHADAHSDSDQD